MPSGPDADDERVRLLARVDTLALIVRGHVQLVALVALAASWLVPVAVIRPEESDSGVERLSLPSLLGRAGDVLSDLPDEARPFSRGWGGWIIVVGVVLLVAATITLGWLVVTAIDNASPLPRRLVTGAAVALLVACGAVLVGLGWYPGFADSVLGDVELGPAWGLWVPAITGLAVLLAHQPLVDLDQLGRRR